jgi:predicted RNase H-like HicB family nuclease
MREAIVFHIEGLIEDGDPVPPPSNATAVVFVDPAAA